MITPSIVSVIGVVPVDPVVVFVVSVIAVGSTEVTVDVIFGSMTVGALVSLRPDSVVLPRDSVVVRSESPVTVTED